MNFSHRDKGNTENLNIYYNTKLLVLKALNRYRTGYEAALHLGISERTLYNYKKMFRIERDTVTGIYKASPLFPPSLKSDILKHLRQVPANTPWAVGFIEFTKEAAQKTDSDFINLLEEIKSQMNTSPDVMENILGNSYTFFQTINQTS